MSNKKVGGFKGWLKTSVWVFPAVLLVLLIAFTVLRISGTSAGMYHERLYGPTQKDSSLIYGKPRAIRSDEWLATTQMIISQTKQDFPRVNQAMGDGQDLSLLPEIPMKDWSTIFKPQNWSFFALPLENAFAFKWWLIMFVLMSSCYFFVLQIMPGNRLFAALMGLAAGLSPFQLWWYQSAVFLSVAYGFMMINLVHNILNRRRPAFIKGQRPADISYAAALIFVIVCFGFILYPPFQIPIAVVVLFYSLGYLLHKKLTDAVGWRTLLRPLTLLLISVVVAGAICGAFIKTHETPIKAINATIYPGHRTVYSGGLKLLGVFDGFVMPAEQSDYRGGHFLSNQSENANYILVLPFLMIPAAAIMLQEWIKKRRVDWTFLAINLTALLFFFRLFVHHGNRFFKFLFLDKVPHNRLLIGVGFVGLLQFVYLAMKIRDSRIKTRTLIGIAVGYGLACFALLLVISGYIARHYPLFLNNYWILACFAAAFSAIIVALLAGRPKLAAALLLGFTLLSTFWVMPIYRGLGELTHGKLIDTMSSVAQPSDTWITIGGDAVVYENFGLVAGDRSLSGTRAYPDIKLWEQLVGTSYESVYNREGHSFFIEDPHAPPMSLNSSDSYFVKFDCQEYKYRGVEVNYLLAVHPINLSCTHLVRQVSYPQATFFIYKVSL